MENLGETFIDGKIVSLENAEIEELNHYLEIVRAKKLEQKNRLNNFLGQIYS